MAMKNPPHPGETLRDWIHGHRTTVVETARRLGVSRASLNRVLAGQSGLSADMAVRLERIGWSDAAFWAALQAQYDVAEARKRAPAA